jgi:leucyl-tRNA synthetase
MTQKYHILWFEDSEAYIEAIKPLFEEYLDTLGFEAVVTPKANATGIEKNLCTYEIDLILMDYHLSGTETGDKIVKKIRDCELYEDTLLYSRDKDFPHNITERLEGVYYARIEEFPEKAKKLINLTIKKQQDINNIRGMFIAEAVDLATEMEEVMVKLLKITQPSVAEYFRTKMLQELFFNDYAKYTFILGSMTEKQNALNRIINGKFSVDEKQKAAVSKAQIDPLVEALVEMEKEVIWVRNVLAHSRPGADKKSLVGKKGIIDFSDAEVIRIRNNFKRHFENLQKIYKIADNIL